MAIDEVMMRWVLIGVIATLLTDGWAWLLRRAGLPTLDYALVGRWLAHMPKGRWWHNPIQRSTAMGHERLLGWLAHYVLGVGFALLLALWVGAAWLQQPTLWPALVFGLASVVVPWCVMQPAFGAGIAASRMPKPWRARLQSLSTHSVFGAGLFVGAWLLA